MICRAASRSSMRAVQNTGHWVQTLSRPRAHGDRTLDTALALINETISLVEANGDLVYMPEALRVQGSVLLSMPQRRAHDAEMCFVRSLDWSRRQGARSWELRTAVDLAALRAAEGQPERARAVLEPIFEAFAEGLDTVDLRAAKHLLATLR